MNFIQKLQLKKLETAMETDRSMIHGSSDVADAVLRVIRAAGDNSDNEADTNSANEDINAATNEEVNTSENVSTENSVDNTEYTDQKTEEANTPTEGSESSPNIEVDQSVDANMTGGTRIKEDNADGVINLGFGVTMDLNAMSKGEKVDVSVAEGMVKQPVQSPNAYIDYLEKHGQYQPPVMGIPFNMTTGTVPPRQFYAMPIQFEQPIVCPPNSQPQAGLGRHKVDIPVQPKPEIKKAEPDNANVDLDKIQFDVEPPKPPKQTPDVINNEITNAEPTAQIPKYDNSVVISQYEFLGEIEKIAVECNAQIRMVPRIRSNNEQTGLITCIVYTTDPNVPTYKKCFTIDTGVIIDRRKKVLAGVAEYGYEDMKAYEIYIPDKNPKSKKIINKKLFTELFIGGVDAITEKPLYTHDYMELNKKVALITLPTNIMNRETRQAVTGRLMAAYKAGVFDAALKDNPYARFRFKNYKKDTQEFTLTTQGVPYRFCEQVRSTDIVDIDFTADGKTNVKLIQPNI